MKTRDQMTMASTASNKSKGCVSVATYNIHRCKGRDGCRDPYRIVDVIREIDADIIGLQELDPRPYPKGKSCRIDDVLNGTGFNVVYGYTQPKSAGRYGNALVTSHRVLKIRRINLSVPGRVPRGAVDVDLEINGQVVQVIVTHLGLRAFERKHQINRLLEALPAEQDRLVIVLGDFNEWTPANRRVRSLCTHLGKCPTLRTFPSLYPMLALDRIWVRPVESLMDIRVHDTPTARIASDHLPLKATINMPDEYRQKKQGRAFG